MLIAQLPVRALWLKCFPLDQSKGQRPQSQLASKSPDQPAGGSFLGALTSIYRSRNCLAETAEGDSVIRSVPLAVLGKAITSRMLGVPQRIALRRSKPKA